MDENPYRTSSLASPWGETSIPPAAIKPLQGSILTLRIIVFALAMGVTMFGGFAVMSNLGKPHTLGWNLQPLNLIMLGFGAMMLLLGAVLPSVIFRNVTMQVAAHIHPAAADPAVAQVLAIQQRWQTATIVGCAFFEGGAFANLFAYFTTCELLNLLMGGILLMGILARFPLPGSCQRRIEDELRGIKGAPPKTIAQ
jgi:hypothetical protein